MVAGSMTKALAIALEGRKDLMGPFIDMLQAFNVIAIQWDGPEIDENIARSYAKELHEKEYEMEVG